MKYPAFSLPRRSLGLLLLVLVVLAGLSAGRPARTAPQLPEGFGESVTAVGLSSPTAMAFAPDGRLFVCEQAGRLRVIKNGVVLPTPFVTLDVNSTGERGLLGVAFDPNFETEPWVYVYYTARLQPPQNRVSRFLADGDVAVLGSEQVLFTLPGLGPFIHNGGALHFGPDGKLYVATGENGQTALAPSLASPLGKILRVNRDGTVPPDNPFLAQTVGINQLIWARGLRNPFTFAFQPGTGLMYINDVGQDRWEEVNTGAPGANYGWPSTEGPTNKNGVTSPTFAYKHNDAVLAGCAITGGAFYNPTTARFPAAYVGRYFFADFCGGWIASFNPAAPGAGATLFATGLIAPVDLRVGPDGALYYLDRGLGGVRRIDYLVDAPPVITIQPTDRLVSVGSPATFWVSASGTPELQYQWERDGNPIEGATEATYTLFPAALSDTGAAFRCVVTNAFGQQTSADGVLTVTANTPPVPEILTPAGGSLYTAGATLAFSGSAADGEDGPLPPEAFTWRIDFHHDDHDHPFLPDTVGVSSGQVAIPTEGETSANVWYRVHLTVTDSAGLSAATFRDVHPRKANVTLASVPAGLEVTLDGQPVVTPFAFEGVAGVVRGLGAPLEATSGELSLVFDSWSDGGAAEHLISTPLTGTTFTAIYRLTAGAPGNLQAAAVSGVRADLTWQDNTEGESGFAVERRQGAGAWQEIAQVGAGVTSYSDDGLTPESAYSFRVRALFGALGTVASNVAQLVTPKAGKLSVKPGKLKFGAVGPAGKAKTLTLRNTGKGPLPLAVGVLDDPFAVTGGGGAATLAPGEKRKVTVRLAPAAPGEFAAVLGLASDDPARRQTEVPCSGKRR